MPCNVQQKDWVVILRVAARNMGRGIMVAIKALGHKDGIITESRR